LLWLLFPPTMVLYGIRHAPDADGSAAS
jgi:hypothetical protein